MESSGSTHLNFSSRAPTFGAPAPSPATAAAPQLTNMQDITSFVQSVFNCATSKKAVSFLCAIDSTNPSVNMDAAPAEIAELTGKAKEGRLLYSRIQEDVVYYATALRAANELIENVTLQQSMLTPHQLAVIELMTELFFGFCKTKRDIQLMSFPALRPIISSYFIHVVNATPKIDEEHHRMLVSLKEKLVHENITS
jgi:hypothetical protein